jgi:hypothetical protein
MRISDCGFRIGLAVRAAVIAVAAPQSTSIAQSDASVPKSLIEHAADSPAAIAWLLAAARVSSSVEFREPDDATAPSHFSSDDPAKVSVPSSVEAFNNAHRDYRAGEMHGVLVIRPVDSPLAFLGTVSTVDLPLTVSGLPTATMTGERRLFAQLDARFLGPSAGSSCRTDSDRITLRAEGRPACDRSIEPDRRPSGRDLVREDPAVGDRATRRRFRSLLSQSAIRNPQSAIRNQQSAIRNPQSAIRNHLISVCVVLTGPIPVIWTITSSVPGFEPS